MQQEQKIAEHALAQLETNTGIHGRWNNLDHGRDGDLTFTIDGKLFHIYAAVKKELRQYQLIPLMEQARQHQPFMIIAEHIFPAIKEKLREEKIAYLDIAGNVFIHTNGTYLWVDGMKAAKKSKVVNNRAFTKAGLRTLFFILLEPEAINMPYRALADKANVALGNIPNVLDGLRETGFILQKNKNERILHNKKVLLRRWIDGYRETLKPSLHLGNYRFLDSRREADWENLELPGDTNNLWGGEAAAGVMTGYLNPQELTLYTNDKRPLLSKWKLIPDQAGTLHLYEKFWQQDNTMHPVLTPPLLVYADLLLTDDPRCIETAAMIYDKYLKDEFESN